MHEISFIRGLSHRGFGQSRGSVGENKLTKWKGPARINSRVVCLKKEGKRNREEKKKA